jgi:hypothetical protein
VSQHNTLKLSDYVLEFGAVAFEKFATRWHVEE